jgi:septal ring-binding cell division protein DamX
MPMSDVLTAGRLEDQPFPALAGRIFREGRSGGLSLESGGRHRTVWFLGGNPAAVVSDDPEDHIARFLLEHGHVNEEEHARLAALPETRQGFADASFLPKEALNWGVKFRFVNICYDLFRWEEGDYSFTEGNPPRDLFLLKVPAHSLIVKGVGYLGRARLLDLVPDEALLAAGVIDAEQARYLGPAERDVLDACRPGSTVGAVLQSGAWEDPERTRALVYALACLGLLTFAPAATAAAPSAPARPADEAAFTLEEPAADAAAFPFPAPSREEGAFSLPSLDDRAGPTTGVDLEAALASAAGPGRFPFEEEATGGPLGSFEESFTAESEEQPAAPPRKAPPAKARAATRRMGGSRLPRLAGIALGAIAACAIVGTAAWWWLGSEKAPPPPAVVAKRPAPPTPTPVPPPPAVTQAPAAPAPAASIPAAGAPLAAVPVPPPAPQPPAVTTPSGGSADRYRNGFDVFRAGDLDGAAAIWEDLLALEHRDAFTLLLLTACQRETIQEAQKTLPARRLYLVPKRVNGRNCFRVCVDTYGSRDEAARALAGLPAEFKAAGASVRPVADVLANR